MEQVVLLQDYNSLSENGKQPSRLLVERAAALTVTRAIATARFQRDFWRDFNTIWFVRRDRASYALSVPGGIQSGSIERL